MLAIALELVHQVRPCWLCLAVWLGAIAIDVALIAYLFL